MDERLARLLAMGEGSPFHPSNVADGYRALSNSQDPYQMYIQEAKKQANRIGNGYADWLGNPMNFVGIINPMSGTPKAVPSQAFDEWQRGVGSSLEPTVAKVAKGTPKPRSLMTEAERRADDLNHSPDEFLGAIPAVALTPEDLIKRLQGRIQSEY